MTIEDPPTTPHSLPEHCIPEFIVPHHLPCGHIPEFIVPHHLPCGHIPEFIVSHHLPCGHILEFIVPHHLPCSEPSSAAGVGPAGVAIAPGAVVFLCSGPATLPPSFPGA